MQFPKLNMDEYILLGYDKLGNAMVHPVYLVKGGLIMFISYTTTSGSEYRIARSQKGQRRKHYADGRKVMQPITNITVFLTRENMVNLRLSFERLQAKGLEALRIECDEIPRNGYHPLDIFTEDYEVERNVNGAITHIIWNIQNKKNGRDFHCGHSIVAGSQILHRN
jgi:hypothetical protein